MSPQKDNGFNDTLPFIHDNLDQDNPKAEQSPHKMEEDKSKVEEEKSKTTIEIIPLGTNQIHLERSKGKHDRIIQYSSSNISLSKEDILVIKELNSTEALWPLQKLCRLSTRATSTNSSNAPMVDVSEGSIKLVNQQLKGNVFYLKLYKAIEEDAKFRTNIHKLLKEINKQRTLDSLVQFLFEFKALFNHIFQNIHLKKAYHAQIQYKKAKWLENRI